MCKKIVIIISPFPFCIIFDVEFLTRLTFTLSNIMPVATPNTTNITLIAAIARNFALGKDNQLLWHLPADFRFFKQTTLHHPIIMGHHTFASIGHPLPQRPNIVVSSTLAARGQSIAGCQVVATVESAITWAKTMLEPSLNEIFIIGGAQIYRYVLEHRLADRMLLTEVQQDFDGDVFFPQFDKNDWLEVSRESHCDEKSGLAFDFVDYRCIPK